MISQETMYLGFFFLLILTILFLDLAVIGRKKHVISFKESISWTAVWVSIALGFWAFLLFQGDKLHGIDSPEKLSEIVRLYAPHLEKTFTNDFAANLVIFRDNMAMEYLSGYLIEYTLSIDNIFVIMMILTAFAVPEKYYKQVLFWGILGAIVLRFFFIFAGAALIHQFEWILYVFGAFLIWTGGKIFFTNEEDEVIDPQNHWLVKFLSRYSNVYPGFYKGYFFIKRKTKVYMTPLFIVLILVEFTDVIFAMDSIPAIFAVTRDPYLVFFSNIFAIMGLRSLFFMVRKVVNLFHYLKLGVAFLLVFVGFKLLLHSWLAEVGFKPVYSIYIILLTIVISIGASVVFPQKEEIKE